jgi:lon-related putative ATP-dependent protease
VILIGDSEIYYLLDAYDAEFPNLFKVLADFDISIPRDRDGILQYAGVLARIARDEDLPPFDRTAVLGLVEHGARIAAHQGKLTARFGRLADIAREAAHIACKEGSDPITCDHVRSAIRRTKRRADLPARRFRELLAEGTIRIQTQGSSVGQVNGLAVLQAGPLTYGFPARITATIGPGTAGVINIDREAALSGAIHTKGFYILGGLLRTLLKTDHPLAFSASLVFEQSYGGIDGDSASCAEICCLLSALTEIPLRQDLAITGAIDQVGNLLPVGGVNEKIEGFYDACHDIGLTGTQGVIIPRANAGDLVLREDVVEACAGGQFRVYAVGTVHAALELLTAQPAGRRDAGGEYPGDSVLGVAMRRAHEYWKKAAPQVPGRPGVESADQPPKSETPTRSRKV